jgi:hypothetical protein
MNTELTAGEKPPGSEIWWLFIDYKGQRKSEKIGTDEGMARGVTEKAEGKLVLGGVYIENRKNQLHLNLRNTVNCCLKRVSKPSLCAASDRKCNNSPAMSAWSLSTCARPKNPAL